jgi:PAS domain S-box-containing protein
MEITNECLQLETDLKKALERKEFRVYFQPKLDLFSGKIIGSEALIRWEYPKKGLVPPVEFISIAEETGLIIPIGEWVLRTACLQNKAWQDAGLSPLMMSVNLSGRQLSQPNFVDRVRLILKETKLSPEYLILEIAESMMDQDQALQTIRELKHVGVQISLDDFGTGFSSLRYLREFPVDNIKINQSFFRNCPSDLNGTTIVKSIIAMAHQLKIVVIAEGIESIEQLVFLQQNLCNLGQGHLFSKPVPPAELVHQFYEIEQIINQVGVSQEVFNQKLMEEALENARQELHDTVRQQQGMIFKLINENGRFIHTLCDGELMYRMDLTPEKVVGKELSDFLPFANAEKNTKYFRKAWEDEENVTFEGEFNGIDYLSSLRPIRRGGKVDGIIGSCVDITNRKQVEKALRMSESNYRLITENMQDVIVKLDKNGRVLYASRSHEDVFGINAKDYKGQSPIDFVHPEDIPSVQTQFATMIETRTPCQVEFRHQHAHGGWVYIEAKVKPVYDANDKIEYFLVVGRDISERKQTQEFIQKTEKLSVVGQLASSIAHEIRNPLTTIKGFAQLLQKEIDMPLYIDTMLSEIRRLEEVVDEFLSFAKPQIHQIKETDLNSLLQQVLLILRSQMLINNIEILQENGSDFPPIHCDGNQIKQAFVHILQNAVEAMPNGGIIKVQMLSHGTESIKIRFIDQGYGISKERVRKIGEPFYSLKEKGTGLGLMISHKIVKDHGGMINIDSIINQGTTVDVILPIKQKLV